MVLDGKGAEVKGFKAIMVKTGVGTLNSTNSSAAANIMYTVYDRDGDNFKVINSKFGRQRFCMDKVKALLELGAVNGVFMTGDGLVCGWELDEGQNKLQEAAVEKKKGA